MDREKFSASYRLRFAKSFALTMWCSEFPVSSWTVYLRHKRLHNVQKYRQHQKWQIRRYFFEQCNYSLHSNELSCVRKNSRFDSFYFFFADECVNLGWNCAFPFYQLYLAAQVFDHRNYLQHEKTLENTKPWKILLFAFSPVPMQSYRIFFFVLAHLHCSIFSFSFFYWFKHCLLLLLLFLSPD